MLDSIPVWTQNTLETPIAQSWYSNSSVPNRINTWSYDPVGNVLQVGGMTRSFVYDAENRQVSATINNNTSTYTYDGNGLRVTKTSGGNTTVYVYDAFGYLAAEYCIQFGVAGALLFGGGMLAPILLLGHARPHSEPPCQIGQALPSYMKVIALGPCI